MKNVLNETDKNHLIERVLTLTPGDAPLFGKMNCRQMICHSADQIKMALGIINSPFQGNILFTLIMKNLILIGMPAPKGKIETTRELKQGVGGTKPAEFNNDRDELCRLINDFDSLYKTDMIITHPAFGRMKKKEWGRLVFIHADYHLKQFGR